MRYRYTLDLQSEDGRSLERAVVTPDWNAALAWVHFEGIRAGLLPAVTRTGPEAVEPLWDDRHGEPHVAAFRVTVGSPGGRSVSREIPRTYLRSLAHERSAGLIERGVLQAGDVFRWVVSAFPLAGAEPVASDPVGDGFGIEEVEQILPIDATSLGALAARSVPAGSVADEAHDLVPVFVPQAVLDEAMALAREAGDLETGGVLVGALHRDADAGDSDVPTLFVEVTAQVPARHTLSASTKLTFTSDTWAAVHAAIALRRRGEIMLGWWHYHPDFCRLRNCPLERRRECTGASPFFSGEDVHLHATCFPAGHQVALLVSDSAAAGGLSSSLFGWSHGAVLPRAFQVIRSERADRSEGVAHVANPIP